MEPKPIAGDCTIVLSADPPPNPSLAVITARTHVKPVNDQASKPYREFYRKVP